mmetsp:Transcript_90428/g.255253  ORF Transcript_90428/g.255253 Transcript_90428/m.255253 type:complete len:225 (-) Transcript_90428:258-932(-)
MAAGLAKPQSNVEKQSSATDGPAVAATSVITRTTNMGGVTASSATTRSGEPGSSQCCAKMRCCLIASLPGNTSWKWRLHPIPFRLMRVHCLSAPAKRSTQMSTNRSSKVSTSSRSKLQVASVTLNGLTGASQESKTASCPADGGGACGGGVAGGARCKRRLCWRRTSAWTFAASQSSGSTQLRTLGGAATCCTAARSSLPSREMIRNEGSTASTMPSGLKEAPP